MKQLSLFQQGEDLPLFQQAQEPETDEAKAAAVEAYEARRQARIDRLNARADKAEAEAAARFETADRMASVIPFGQPILVGHHSEAADRRYRDRIHQNMRKGMDAKHEAADLRHRAEAAERNRAIFSDDPQASEKIADKIQRLEQRQELMKQANKLVRKQDRDGLAELGFSEAVINGLLEPDFCGRLGFPDYMLSNNGANIRRLKKRLDHLEAIPTETTTETEHEDYKIVHNAEEYRAQIIFTDKPPSDVRARLKTGGFRWAPSQGAWQRHLNQAGRLAAQAFDAWYKSPTRTRGDEAKREGHGIPIGAIFNFTWGYEQTNQDFYEVISATACNVTIREIESKLIEGSKNGPMCGRVVALPGQFKDSSKPLVKRVQFKDGKPYLTMASYGWCELWDGEPEYVSYYG